MINYSTLLVYVFFIIAGVQKNRITFDFKVINMRLRYKIDELRNRIQRFKRGYAYRDVWEMYDWFIKTAKPMLVHLRNHHCGVPMEFENNEDGWDDILDEMIRCLDMMDEENVYDHFGFGSWGYWKKMNKEDYENIYRTMEENKNCFFELFSKYFYDMWD